MPEAALATPDEEIQCAVVVVVADRDRTGASDRVGGTREATHRVVEKQTIAADLARDEHVGAPVVVHIAEGGIGSALDDPVSVGSQGEGAIEVVAIDRERVPADEQQVQIAVVIEIDEQRAPGTVDVSHMRGCGDILKLPPFAVVQQVAAAVGSDHEQIEPAVVVVVRECRAHRAGRKREGDPLAGIRDKALPERVEPNIGWRPRNQQIVFAVVVVVAQRQRRGRGSPPEVRQPAFAGHIGEVNACVGGGRDAAHRDERCRIEREHRPSDQRPFRPVHLGERRLIGCRDFHEPQETIELGPGSGQTPDPQRRDCGVEVRLRFARRLGTELAHVFEIPQRAVALTQGEQHVRQLETHGEIGGRTLQHLAQPLGVALLPAVPAAARPALTLELGQSVERARVRDERQQLARLIGPVGQRIELRQRERDVDIRGIEPPRPLQLRLGVAVAAGSEVGQSEVRVPERVPRRERDHFAEFLLCFSEAPALQIVEADCTGGDQRALIDRLFAAADRDEEQRRRRKRTESFHAILAPLAKTSCVYARPCRLSPFARRAAAVRGCRARVERRDVCQ